MAEEGDFNFTLMEALGGQEAAQEVNVTLDNLLDPANSTFLGSIFSCEVWTSPQHLLFQLANGCFFVSYLAPSQSKGLLFMHCVLIIGFLLYSTWAWNVICAPDVFSWNFTFMLLNMGQTLYIIYQMRPVKLNKELEAMYEALFQPLNVPRLLFKRLVSVEYAQVMSLHAGEAYAMQNLTRTDRLGLLLSGKVNVMADNQFLHSITSMQFIDSPEFESSRASLEDKFKVSIIAATSCRYVFWHRTSLEYLFVKESYLAAVLSTLIARDITTKLYHMNQKIVTEKGSHLDIRLPSLTSSLSSSCGGEGSLRSPARFSIRSGVGGGLGGGHGGSGSSAGGVGCGGGLASSLAGVAGMGTSTKHSRLGYTILPTSAPRYEGRDRLDLAYREGGRGTYRENGYVPNGRPEMTPLTELPSTDSLTDAAHDIHTWLEDSSRYTQRE
ncbi:popeye domain-containing protein 3-like isoform X2 [Eriocheir sinensis]|uniref:popeye domain-containing protein 3-like isoform X2 n=1 Tax=Eriocheir sinensis TaxID=95602 RepID=UPI0021C97D8F|nr:popeye domain-containing protein 3-like isoform X2 [Eriocheir sinensis]